MNVSCNRSEIFFVFFFFLGIAVSASVNYEGYLTVCDTLYFTFITQISGGITAHVSYCLNVLFFSVSVHTNVQCLVNNGIIIIQKYFKKHLFYIHLYEHVHDLYSSQFDWISHFRVYNLLCLCGLDQSHSCLTMKGGHCYF